MSTDKRSIETIEADIKSLRRHIRALKRWARKQRDPGLYGIYCEASIATLETYLKRDEDLLKCAKYAAEVKTMFEGIFKGPVVLGAPVAFNVWDHQ